MKQFDVLVTGDRTEEIVEWLYGNIPFLAKTYWLLEHQEHANMHAFDTIFHDSIRKQTKEYFISLISVACSRDTGTSMEDFLMVMEDDIIYDRLVGLCETWDGIC